jgi:FG-GAP repeat
METSWMKPLFKCSAVAGVLVVGALGCDWRKLDEAVEKAPVVSVEAPGGYAADDVGRLIVPLPYDPTTPAVIGRYAFFGQTRASGGLVEFDATGKASVYAIPDAALVPLMAESINSAIWIGPKAGQLLVGTQGAGGALDPGATWFLDIAFAPGAKPVFTFGSHVPTLPAHDPIQSTPDRFWGAALAVGDVTGNAFLDQVIMSRDHVFLIEDGARDKPPFLSTNGSNCDVSLDTFLVDGRMKVPRPLAIADIAVGGAAEILVGLPRGMAGQKGVVRIMRKSLVVETGMFSLDCSNQIVAAPDATPESAAGFGSSIAPIDLDGDGKKESLLVGSPPDRAYIINGPIAVDDNPMNRLLATPIPAQITVMPPTPAAGFGLRVDAFDFDGQPGDEIIVSAPDQADGSKAQAGQVFVFKWDPVTGKAIFRSSVKDNQSESIAMLGYDVAGMPFVTPACAATGKPPQTGTLLLAGTRAEIFTYFRTPIAPGIGAPLLAEIPDPRCQ